MSLVYWLHQPSGLVDITGRCRLYAFDMKENAEEGSTAVNTLIIDDPDGDFEVIGHRALGVEETEAEDPDERFVFVGFIGDAKVVRGPYRTGASRQWACEVSDINTILARPVMVGADNDRPAELDYVRVAWLEATTEQSIITDTRYLSTANGVDMDANDYTTQDALAIYNDCAQQSGKNWFLTYFGDTGVTATKPWGAYSIWYDFASGAEYNSTGRLTNVLADVDIPNDTFWVGLEESSNVLDRDPMRIYSFIVVPFNGGYATAYRPNTTAEYANRSKVMPAVNVRTIGTARARANRYADDLDTPEDRGTLKATLPRAKVNVIRPGMNVDVKISHWPGYEDWTTMRVLTRRVVEISESDTESAFECTYELTRSVPGPPAVPVYGVLYGSGGPYDTENGTGLVHWANPGDTPGPGWDYRPTTGLISMLTDATPPHPSRTHYGWQVTGTGTINVRTFITTYGIYSGGTTYTITAAITKNGVIVASEVESLTPSTDLLSFGWDPTVTISGLAVAPGDIIETRLLVSPSKPAFWRTPRGSGQNGEMLEIFGGSLA